MEDSIHASRLFGEIVSFNPEKHFGFIEDQSGTKHFFYQSEQNFIVDLEEGLILKRYYATVGDTVSFTLRPNFREDDPPVAAGLVRMANFHRLDMIRMSTQREFLVGTLMSFGKNFCIRHRETQAMVNVNISVSSRKPEEWLAEKVGYWVRFVLTKSEDEEKVCAYVLDIPQRESVKKILCKIELGEQVQGKVVHRSNAGITLFLKEYYFNGNLSIKSSQSPEEIDYFDSIKMGQFVSAYPTEFLYEKGLVKMNFFRPRDESQDLILEKSEGDVNNSTSPSEV
ncbi:hypothetical protein [Algoriphagus marinus]|uniref:hypothetical protein n=1 Tax=Algoriphagus marinus TaxID=1925762 RepID=UPI00094B9A2C|nr:hypothetical protein [Algoriphagus marinus]